MAAMRRAAALCADLLRPALNRRSHVPGLGQHGCIVRTEKLAAEADRRVHLGLPESAVIIAGVTKRIHQCIDAVLKILLSLTVAALSCLIERELTGKVPACDHEGDRRL